jgi:hypothetical protein
VIAERNIAAGEQLTFPYVKSPSKARLLTSFGFASGPAASLVAADLPQRDTAWLARHGCEGEALGRTDLHLQAAAEGGGAPTLTEPAVRDALRCVRLQLYLPHESAHALSSGYLSRECSKHSRRTDVYHRRISGL